MKYLVTINQSKPDGTDTPAMTAYDDYQKAVSAFHMELAYGAISDQLSSDMAMLTDTTGRVYEVTIVQGLAKPKAATTTTDASVTTDTGTSAGTTTTTTADAATTATS